MSEHALVPESCRRPRKDGGLAQVLQRRTPSWGNRPKDADNAAGSRWRSQPGIVSKAEKSNRQRSKIGLTAMMPGLSSSLDESWGSAHLQQQQRKTIAVG